MHVSIILLVLLVSLLSFFEKSKFLDSVCGLLLFLQDNVLENGKNT